WISILLMAGAALLFQRVKRDYEDVDRQTRVDGPLELHNLTRPIVGVPIKGLNKGARKGLEFAMTISSEVHAVQIAGLEDETSDLRRRWRDLVETPAQEHGYSVPTLVVLRSAYRKLVEPLMGYLHALNREHPQRRIAVLIPELVERRWYQFALHGHTA